MSGQKADARPVVTFSFDDGHHDDLKVAERLAAFGGKATFYVAFNDPHSMEIEPAGIRALHAMGHEIGSHTLSHRMLVTLTPAEIDRELGESKARLEDITGAAVTALSYPLGYINRHVLLAMDRHGYRLGRTLVRFRYDRAFDPLHMPVTVEFGAHSRFLLAKHIVRDVNVRGALNWLGAGCVHEPLDIARALYPRAVAAGGICHIYARSWEIEQFGQWDAFDTLLRLVASGDVEHRTNSSAAGVA